MGLRTCIHTAGLVCSAWDTEEEKGLFFVSLAVITQMYTKHIFLSQCSFHLIIQACNIILMFIQICGMSLYTLIIHLKNEDNYARN